MRVTFQDSLFNSERVVERVLPGGTTLRLTLEPLSEGRVRVLAYSRRRAGERWQRVKDEEGRTFAFAQLGLPASFTELFGADTITPVVPAPVRRKKVRR